VSKQIAQTVAQRSGYSAGAVAKIISVYHDVIKDALLGGAEVRLPEIGLLRVFSRGARAGRNPRTGESVLVAPSRGVRLRVSTALKKALNAA
jgi:DNA-binding protein HU-beta